MINIEGDYDEVVKGLDEEMAYRYHHRVHGGVRNSMSHGIYYDNDDGLRERANVGLFSLCDDPGDKIGSGSHCCCYDYKASTSWEVRKYELTEEELAHSHEIVF